MSSSMRTLWFALAIGVLSFLVGCEPPPVKTVQRGYRGLGMVQLYNPHLVERQLAANTLPAAVPAVPPGGEAASTVYKNVKVLNQLSVNEFTRLMVALTGWVSPQQGCAYCHAGADFASDALYTKVVARRMLEMTRHINGTWNRHVGATGVTCYTCHRGQPVPANLWFKEPGPRRASGLMASNAGQNMPATQVGTTSLPYDPLSAFLTKGGSEIRTISTTALPAGNRHSIKQTEWTYGLMIHMSKALGVNCTYCHNSRSFFAWDASTPQRTVAWHGIRLVRDLNSDYLEPLRQTFPTNRLGPLGDAPKVNCTTCHQGAYKPLYGQSMLGDFPELAKNN